jgi:alpha-tubulin suppressor-like RCC1 family protein
LPSGSIVFIEQFNVLMMSVGTQWRGIDGRTYVPRYTAYAWGQNNYGQLGNNTTSARSSPVTVVGGITNWTQLAGGGTHSLGVTSTGIIYAWGNNNYGQLGNNTTSARSSPVTVVGGITNWSQISAGGRHSLGLTSAGITYGWGNNSFGQLADGTSTSRLSPVTVVGGITTWSQIEAGDNHSLGVISTGVAYGWGYNTVGTLGDNTITNRSSPVTVVGGITNWSQVAGGTQHSLGRTATGIAYAWGLNSSGRLGDNTTSARSSPVTVVGGITNWSQVGAGSNHSLGRTATGIAYAWGLNSSGQLGDNTTSDRSSPVTVVGGITNWSQVGIYDRHSLGIINTGIIYAWGYNSNGQLGNNTTSSRSSPVTIVGGITNWTQVTAGRNHSLGLVII